MARLSERSLIVPSLSLSSSLLLLENLMPEDSIRRKISGGISNSDIFNGIFHLDSDSRSRHSFSMGRVPLFQ